ncbi:erv1/Alr family protein [Wolffia australiana]
MGQNPFEIVLRSYSCLVQSVQTYALRLFPVKQEENYNHQPLTPVNSSLSLTLPPSLRKSTQEDNADVFALSKEVSLGPTSLIKGSYSVPLTKEELGRCTWTLLHMIAAQFPERPTRQQKRDAKELMGIISRLYPCKDCSDHYKEILRSNPVQAGSREEFSQWLCHVHNVVNRSLGKPIFPCQRVSARWQKLGCEDRGCDVDAGDVSVSP